MQLIVSTKSKQVMVNTIQDSLTQMRTSSEVSNYHYTRCRHRRRTLSALRLRPLTDLGLPVDPVNVIEGTKLMDVLKLPYMFMLCNIDKL